MCASARRLASVDRPAMIEGALSGFGAVANDVSGYGIQYFDRDLIRHQDERAGPLALQSRRRAGSRFTLQTSSVQPGFGDPQPCYREQAVAAGVKVNLMTLAPSEYCSYQRYVDRVAHAHIWPKLP